ncbi:hypothetical protein, partial [Actinomadura rubrisoli]|uniref:hypothetical protein n=1 Tax=Actinomadura rubrisoli TaxID=2530368 RepID=UPI001A9CD92B
SQETDTHRAGSAFAFPAPGRLDLTYQIRSACQFPSFSDPTFPTRSRGLPGWCRYFIRSSAIVKTGLFCTTTGRQARQSRVG